MAEEKPQHPHDWRENYLGLLQCKRCYRIIYSFMKEKEPQDCSPPPLPEAK